MSYRLSPRATLEVAFARRAGVSPDTSLPISLFIPPEQLGPLQALAATLRDAWRAIVSAALSRDQLPDRARAQAMLEAIVREQPVGPPQQDDTIHYPIERLAAYADRRPAYLTRPPLRIAIPQVAATGELLGRLATTGVSASELQTNPDPLLGALQLGGLLTSADVAPRTLRPGTIAHLGHATLLANLGGAHILVDPWLPPASAGDVVPPPSPAELPPLAGIFITHHHWDHVHPDTLLRLPKATPIYVPAQDPAAALRPRTEHLLAYLGFTHIVSLSPGDVVSVGEGGEVVAAPFFGEDPTRLRYRGCCYVLRHAGRSALVHVDSSVDVLGRSLANTGEAAKLVARYGPLDPVFATRRQEKGLAIDHTWDFVLQPPSTWLAPTENCCNDAAALAELARATQTRRLVLYSEGGADWYPDGTDFLRRATPTARAAPFEYLWDSLDVITAAVPAQVVLSQPFDELLL